MGLSSCSDQIAKNALLKLSYGQSREWFFTEMKYTCRSCGEAIEKDFDSCWRCGTGQDVREPAPKWLKEHPHSYPPMPDIACDIVGSRSGAYERKLRESRTIAM